MAKPNKNRKATLICEMLCVVLSVLCLVTGIVGFLSDGFRDWNVNNWGAPRGAVTEVINNA